MIVPEASSKLAGSVAMNSLGLRFTLMVTVAGAETRSSVSVTVSENSRSVGAVTAGAVKVDTAMLASISVTGCVVAVAPVCVQA